MHGNRVRGNKTGSLTSNTRFRVYVSLRSLLWVFASKICTSISLRLLKYWHLIMRKKWFIYRRFNRLVSLRLMKNYRNDTKLTMIRYKWKKKWLFLERYFVFLDWIFFLAKISKWNINVYYIAISRYNKIEMYISRSEFCIMINFSQ